MQERVIKLDNQLIAEAIQRHPEWDIGILQVVAYVAAGGGMIGRMYAEQPADAYVDIRVSRRPYSLTALENIRKTLCVMAVEKNLDPHRLPPMPDFYNCGVF